MTHPEAASPSTMYCQHFGFAKEPFGVSPDSRFLFWSDQHTEAISSLYYIMSQRRGFAVVIGAPGLGKTSLLVDFAERIKPQAHVAFFVRPRFESGSMMESILLALGHEPQPEAFRRDRQFFNLLADFQGQGKTCIVIIDEAQHLDHGCLETLRLLSNFETPRQKLIQFVLAGQPALAKLLRSPECEQAFQRVNVVARLRPFTVTEVKKYINHRLEVAGAVRNPFSASAIQSIAGASNGLPRAINALCFDALSLAFAEDKRIVDAASVAEVLKDGSLNETEPAFAHRSDNSYTMRIKVPRSLWAPARYVFRAFAQSPARDSEMELVTSARQL